ncbi:MAG: hypothetical protein B6244_13515 [Candidatus Cloacimonetes bacterium 4572_55]|nr:MAG: hypothetical protein B6244_13515 [Candidatus Cloacimonetes bacterium 4572_55]
MKKCAVVEMWIDSDAVLNLDTFVEALAKSEPFDLDLELKTWVCVSTGDQLQWFDDLDDDDEGTPIGALITGDHITRTAALLVQWILEHIEEIGLELDQFTLTTYLGTIEDDNS